MMQCIYFDLEWTMLLSRCFVPRKHERSCSQRGWIQGLMVFTVCSIYVGVVMCNDPFNIDLWCPAYSGSEHLVLNKLAFFCCLCCHFCLSFSWFLISHYHVIIFKSIFVHYVSFKTCLVSIFSECPTMKSSGTRTTSSLSSTSSWWCTWSGRSQTTDGSTKSTCVCVNGYVGLSLHESVSPEDKIRVCFMYECQQISETPTDNWRHL